MFKTTICGGYGSQVQTLLNN